MNKITEKQLKDLVTRINILTDSPLEPWSKDTDGKLRADVRNYHLDWAYGGVALRRMDTVGGGISDVLGTGFSTKRELYNQLHAFIRGMEIMSNRNPVHGEYCGEYLGYSIYFARISYSCPELAQFGYGTENQLKNKIKEIVAKQSKGAQS